MSNNISIDKLANQMLTVDFPIDPNKTKHNNYVTIFYDDSTKEMGESLISEARKIKPKEVYGFNLNDLDRCHIANNPKNNSPAQFLPVVEYFLKKSNETIFIANIKDGEQKSFLAKMNDIISSHKIVNLYKPNLNPRNYL